MNKKKYWKLWLGTLQSIRYFETKTGKNKIQTAGFLITSEKSTFYVFSPM